MPKTFEIELPNGAILYDVPESASHDEIAKEAIRQGIAKPDDFPSLDFSPVKAIKNIPRSGGQLLSNILESVYNIDQPEGPIGSLIGLGGAAIGGYGGLLGMDVPEKLVKPAYDLADSIKNRYGSVNALKVTAENDPLGVAMDLAGTLSGMGSLSKGLGASKLGTGLQYASDAVSPVTNTVRGLKAIQQAMLSSSPINKLPLALYNNAMKFSTPAIAKEALARKVLPGSLDELLEAKKAAYNDYMDVVDSASNKTIPASQLFEGLDQVKQKLPNPNIVASAEHAAFDNYVQQLAEQIGYKPSPTQPLGNLIRQQVTPQTSTLLGPNGQPIQLPPIPPTYADPLISIPDLQDFKSSGWDKLLKDNGDQKRLTPSAARGIQQAQQKLTHNASSELNAALGEPYIKANKEYGILNDITREEKGIENRLGKADVLHASTVVPTGLSMVVGNMIGGIPGALAGGVAALGLSHLNNPATRLKLGLAMDAAKNRTLMDYLQTKTPTTTTVIAGANAQERKRRKEALK